MVKRWKIWQLQDQLLPIIQPTWVWSFNEKTRVTQKKRSFQLLFAFIQITISVSTLRPKTKFKRSSDTSGISKFKRENSLEGEGGDQLPNSSRQFTNTKFSGRCRGHEKKKNLPQLQFFFEKKQLQNLTFYSGMKNWKETENNKKKLAEIKFQSMEIRKMRRRKFHNVSGSVLQFIWAEGKTSLYFESVSCTIENT
ncbi:hypothetical protein NPIL_184351 [Nephila pilipes]|uniref:Uncharacterized protein n=1 Tax=Nephila pilipes TaxID=299642 RepID=A0A8X6TRR4_NEPPI|nr:hypothetical protein NPIL_184351 [Nephila pilipes]